MIIIIKSNKDNSNNINSNNNNTKNKNKKKCFDDRTKDSIDNGSISNND